MPRESHVVLCVVWMRDRKCAQHAKMNTCGQSLRANSLSPHTLSPGKHKLWLKYCSKGLLWIMYLIHLLSSSWPLYFGLWQRYLEQLGYFGNQARVVTCYKSNPAVSGVKEIYLILAAWKPLWITEIGWGVRGFMETESYAYVVSGVLIRHPERWHSLGQQSPTFLAPGTSFMEDNSSMNEGCECVCVCVSGVMVSGWFKNAVFIVHFISITITSAPLKIIRH